MGKRSKRKAHGPGVAPPPPRPRKAAWWIYGVVGLVVIGWLAVMASWLLGLF